MNSQYLDVYSTTRFFDLSPRFIAANALSALRKSAPENSPHSMQLSCAGGGTVAAAGEGNASTGGDDAITTADAAGTADTGAKWTSGKGTAGATMLTIFILSTFRAAWGGGLFASTVSAPPHCITAKNTTFTNNSKPNIHFIMR